VLCAVLPTFIPRSLPRPLQNALAGFVIPALPDVTKIPEPSWEGWSPVLEALGVERSDAQLVADTVERAQHTLSGLLSAALHSGQQVGARLGRTGRQTRAVWESAAA